MTQLFRLSGSVKRDPSIEHWMKAHPGELGALARLWFGIMRSRGDDVREIMHDGYPTVCVADAPFAYVGVFKVHVNIGFFRGAVIADPKGLLEGTGKLMRHVKLRPGHDIDAVALTRLVDAAYADIKGARASGGTTGALLRDRKASSVVVTVVKADVRRKKN